MADINVEKNISILEDYVQKNELLSCSVKQSIQEHNEVIKILLERLQKKQLGRKSSEKSSPKSSKNDRENQERIPRDQLPSVRYPNLPVIEYDVKIKEAPDCPCCQTKMHDSEMTENIEYMAVIPKKYLIYRFLKHTYTCKSCYEGILTAALPPRILPGSSYGDEVIMDVALSKYCDLLPMERYVQMAARMGVEGLPANSLIGLTHHFADFVTLVYGKLGREVLAAVVVLADETPHKMLEGGDGKKSWYLWGFSTDNSCFFDIRNTRAGLVAEDFLKDSNCLYLVSDVFSGYAKAVSDVNAYRKQKGLSPIIHVYCNAHARRKFKDSEENFPEESKTFIVSYREIYKLEKDVKKNKEASFDERLTLRKKMGPFFAAMKGACEKLVSGCSTHSSLGRGIRYFLNNFKGLTRCLDNPNIPLDNNAMERRLRSPVVGRKTWYGTHSKRGAETAAKLFSIVESCKLNGINPREYIPYVVAAIHQGLEPPTPYEYAKMDKKDRISIPDG